ncbi:MAG: 2-oxo-4-hydroxy-4-carboxy-5-ureidoimidazoline decarboxylase [Nocardioidaceae bacterium]
MRSIEDFNAAPADEVTAALLACCAVPGWAAAIAEGRPYADAPALLARADQAARRLTPAEVDLALAAHPRIGERPAGADPGAAWSRQEQAAVDRDDETAPALAEGNRAYEDRFGRVYLVCASGRSGAELLADLRRRLGNDDATEAAVVADELRKIALLRLGKVVTT